MYVGVDIEEIPSRCGERHHPRAKPVTPDRGGGHHLLHGLVGRPAEPAPKLGAVDEIRPQHFRQGERPHCVPDLFEHLVGQESREGRSTLCPTTRAEASLLAACRHEVLIATVRASDASKARLKSAAVQVGVDDIVDEDSPEAVALLEAPLPDTLDLVVQCLDQAIERRFLRLAGTIEAYSSALCRQGILLPLCSVEGSTERDPNWVESQATTTPRCCHRGATQSQRPFWLPFLCLFVPFCGYPPVFADSSPTLPADTS